jgi:hypothetical protein
MLTEQPVLITSIKCTEVGGITKNRFISFNGAFGSEGQKSLGVVNADTNADEMTPVTVKGIAIVQSGGPISIGRALQAFDDGTAVQQDSGPLEGYAMDAAASAYQLIRILLV